MLLISLILNFVSQSVNESKSTAFINIAFLKKVIIEERVSVGWFNCIRNIFGDHQ